MAIESDPLKVLLTVKAEMTTILSDELVSACYQLQSEHQYDKDRVTINKMKALVEDAIADFDDEAPS
jgi:S-adenosylmethionine/arginine decarboxylase-like enzyme